MRYATIGFALIFAASSAYSERRCEASGSHELFCSEAVVLAVATPPRTPIERQNEWADDYHHKIQLTQARVEHGELASQSAQVRSFPNEASARSYVQTLGQELLSARAAQTTEKLADPWWISPHMAGDVLPFHLLVGNAVTPQLYGIVYELARVSCVEANQSASALYFVMTGSDPIARNQESVFNVLLQLPLDHPLHQQSFVQVCGTVVGVF
jgi:hypothetical protein